jgi:hypothetical protein
MPRNTSIRYILTEKQLSILGEIASASAQLESTTGFMIMMVLNITVEDYEAIITPMNLSTRLEVMKKVGMQRIKRKKRAKEFKELMEHLKDCVIQRNTVIHGLWGPEGKMTLGQLMMVMTGHEKPGPVEAKNKNRVFKAVKLEQLAKDLDEGGTKLWDIARATWLKKKIARDRKVKPQGALASLAHS